MQVVIRKDHGQMLIESAQHSLRVERGVQKGKVVENCVHTKRGVKSTNIIKRVERVFSFKCSHVGVYWGYQSVWQMYGKGIKGLVRQW